MEQVSASDRMLRALGRRHTHRILTRIAAHPATASEVSTDLALPLSTVVNYLAELEEVEVLTARSERSRTRPVRRFSLVSNPVRVELSFPEASLPASAQEGDAVAYLRALDRTMQESLGRGRAKDHTGDPWQAIATEHAELREHRGPRFQRMLVRAALSRLEDGARQRVATHFKEVTA